MIANPQIPNRLGHFFEGGLQIRLDAWRVRPHEHPQATSGLRNDRIGQE